MGKNEDALKYYKKALGINGNIKNQQGVANNLCNIGIIYSSSGDFEKTLKLLQRAFDIYKRNGNKELKAKCLLNIGSVYMELGKFNETLKCYTEALIIFKSIGLHDKVKIIQDKINTIKADGLN